jgi:hypothetical protein
MPAANDYALKWTSNHAYDNIVELLLANVRADDEYYFVYSLINKYNRIIELLIANGANIHIVNKK